jgi:hypothetical protein
MLQACHRNVVQTHHVLMWQRAKAVIDDCGHEFGAALAAQQEQQQQQQLLLPAFGGSGVHDDAAAEAAAAAAGCGNVSPQEGGRRYSNLHVDNSTGTGTGGSACGVLNLSAADSAAACGWMGAAGMADDDEDELEAQTCMCLAAATVFPASVACKLLLVGLFLQAVAGGPFPASLRGSVLFPWLLILLWPHALGSCEGVDCVGCCCCSDFMSHALHASALCMLFRARFRRHAHRLLQCRR